MINKEIKFMKTTALLILMLLVLSNTAMSYDEGLAQSYEKFFKPFTKKGATKSLHKFMAKDLIKAINAKEDLIILDVRTSNEKKLININLPNTISIPMNKVFTKQNLSKIPKDKKIIIICAYSGRSVAISIGLRHIGFNNIYILKGGFAALAEYINPKTVY